RAQAALHAVNAIQSGGLALTGGPTGESLMLSGQSPVLRIIVENLFYPVTLEVLHQCESSEGLHTGAMRWQDGKKSPASSIFGAVCIPLLYRSCPLKSVGRRGYTAGKAPLQRRFAVVFNPFSAASGE
ncbi:hypothetical protein AB205_0205330, partial [Aquarana catesbeiana]